MRYSEMAVGNCYYFCVFFLVSFILHHLERYMFRLIKNMDFLDWFTTLVLGGGSLTLALFSCHESYSEKAECKAHGGVPYVEEETVTKSTSKGCRVVGISSFSKECFYLGTIYVTECQGKTMISDGKKPTTRKP